VYPITARLDKFIHQNSETLFPIHEDNRRTYCCEKFVTVTDGWDKSSYVPTPSFGRQRVDITTQPSVPTSELSCRRSVRSTTRAHETFNVTSTITAYNKLLATTTRTAYSKFRTTSDTRLFRSPSLRNSIVNRLELTNFHHKHSRNICTQTIWNTNFCVIYNI